jgi:hypothetical protein
MRHRSRLGVTAASCGLCGHEGQVLTQSRRVRRGFDLLNPLWDARERTFEECPGCGARRLVEDHLAA